MGWPRSRCLGPGGCSLSSPLGRVVPATAGVSGSNTCTAKIHADTGAAKAQPADHLRPVRPWPLANRSCGPTAKSRRVQEITRGGDKRW